MNNQNMVVEPKKKSPVGLIILIIILMCGCFVGGYFLNESGVFSSTKKDVEEKETKEKEDVLEKESLDVNSELVKQLDRNITTAGAPYYGGFYELFTNKKMTANDLTDDAKGKVVALRLYDKTSAGSYINWEGTTYTKAEVEEVVKKVFGSDVVYNHKTIGACPYIDYDTATEKYTVGPSGCGGTVGPYHNMHKVVEAFKQGKELTLSIRVVFGDGSKFYSDYAKTNVIPDETDEYDSPTIKDFSKGTLYNAVFKLENDNYALSYVEPAK